jgi:hypothetical protein
MHLPPNNTNNESQSHSPFPTPTTTTHSPFDNDSPMEDAIPLSPPFSVDEDAEMGGVHDEAVSKKSEQPAVKESAASRFRMGFRPSCEKCRMKVPGHYSHF